MCEFGQNKTTGLELIKFANKFYFYIHKFNEHI